MFNVLFKPLFSRLFMWVSEVLDRRVGWHRLSVPLGLATLMGIREKLRKQNLHDTWSVPRCIAQEPKDGRYLTARGRRIIQRLRRSSDRQCRNALRSQCTP